MKLVAPRAFGSHHRRKSRRQFVADRREGVAHGHRNFVERGTGRPKPAIFVTASKATARSPSVSSARFGTVSLRETRLG